MASELLPCPFCNTKPLVSENNVPGNWYAVAECANRNCPEQPSVYGDHLEDVRAKWNSGEAWATPVAPVSPDATDCPACGGTGQMGPFFPGGLSTICGNCNPTPDATGKCGELVTVAWQRKHPTAGWMDCGEEYIPHYRDHGQEVRELVTRSQAGDLLAAERARAAEKERLRFEGDLDKWMKIIGAGITGYQPEAYALMDLACHELVKLRSDISAIAGHVDCEADSDSILHIIRDLEADNAALAARVKELEAERDTADKTLYEQVMTSNESLVALEAKLAAAEKALEPFADHANDRAVDDTGWRDKETVKIVVSIGDLRKARAVLGGKPS